MNNFFFLSSKGTLIQTKENIDEKGVKYPTAATVKPNVTVIDITSNRKSLAHGFLATIFTVLNKHGIALDLISTSEVSISMAVSLNEKETQKLPTIVKELETVGKVN